MNRAEEHALRGDPKGGPLPDAGGRAQLSLFEGIAGPQAEAAPRSDPADAAVEALEPDPRQIPLFAEPVVLRRELDLALAAGRFEEASRLGHALHEAFGPISTARSLSLLDRLAGLSWEGPAQHPLSAWAEMDLQLATEPFLRSRLSEGVFARLLETRTAAELLAAKPECLPDLVRALRRSPGRSERDACLEARAVVRDALLAGRALEAVDFREDGALAELLAEDLSPPWLACLGRLRRLWPLPLPSESEWPALCAFAQVQTQDIEPALAFWQCMRLAGSPRSSDELRRQARVRMKRLHPELHALFMRREGVP